MAIVEKTKTFYIRSKECLIAKRSSERVAKIVYLKKQKLSAMFSLLAGIFPHLMPDEKSTLTDKKMQ